MILHQGFCCLYSFSYTYIGLSISAFEVGLSLNFYCIIGSGVHSSNRQRLATLHTWYFGYILICTARRTVGTDTRVNSLEDGSYVYAVPSINAWSRARKIQKHFKSGPNTDSLSTTTSVMTVLRHVRSEVLPLGS